MILHGRRIDGSGYGLAENSRVESDKQAPGQNRDPGFRIHGLELAALLGTVRRQDSGTALREIPGRVLRHSEGRKGLHRGDEPRPRIPSEALHCLQWKTIPLSGAPTRVTSNYFYGQISSGGIGWSSREFTDSSAPEPQPNASAWQLFDTSCSDNPSSVQVNCCFAYSSDTIPANSSGV
jgi:hypothetical protein